MSIGKRILDLAKANLNALLDKASEETPVEQLTDEELEAELARRKERKRRQDEERKAAERAAQSARARANQQSPPPRTGATTPPPRTGAPPPRTSAPPPRTNAPPPRTSAPPPRTSAPPPRTPPPRQEQRKSPFLPSLAEKRLRELYAQLETPYGAPFEDVKKSFRRLMRKYHPDLHIGNPAKHKTATQLTMSLTQAYNELEVHLTRGR